MKTVTLPIEEYEALEELKIKFDELIKSDFLQTYSYQYGMIYYKKEFKEFIERMENCEKRNIDLLERECKAIDELDEYKESIFYKIHKLFK